jgi:hypothetical protein
MHIANAWFEVAMLMLIIFLLARKSSKAIIFIALSISSLFSLGQLAFL